MKTLKLFIRVLLIPVWITIFFIYLFIWYIQMSWYYFDFNDSEIEKVVKYVSILNKLKPLKDHWGICFDNYEKEYPGEYIGLSEVEYNVFMDLLDCEFYISKERSEIQSCLASRNEYSFLVFQGIEIYYYDENNTKYKVEWN